MIFDEIILNNNIIMIENATEAFMALIEKYKILHTDIHNKEKEYQEILREYNYSYESMETDYARIKDFQTQDVNIDNFKSFIESSNSFKDNVFRYIKTTSNNEGLIDEISLMYHLILNNYHTLNNSITNILNILLTEYVSNGNTNYEKMQLIRKKIVLSMAEFYQLEM